MAQRMRMSTEHLTPVTCRNPITGQVLTTTKKVFESIYQDKGFEEVTRDNVDDRPARSSKAKTAPQSINTGSAASIAATLGIGNQEGTGEGSNVQDPPAGGKSPRIQGEPRRETTPANNAGSDVEETENADDLDPDSTTITGEREPNKRDRGRG